MPIIVAMCGWLTTIGDRWADDFDDALDCLASRGPDDKGVWHDRDVRLGHRRLAVIDIGGGHQPMSSPDGRYWIAYNGEIYNFRELRRQLEALGEHFTSHCDTEVLLRAFVQWPMEKMLPRLDGMFSFAIWDRNEQVLYAARDRFGIKPLFYAPQPEGLILSSTLQPFFSLRQFPRRLNYEALREFLACQSIPSPLTMLRDVKSLPPASWLTWKRAGNQLLTGRYWQIPPSTDVAMDFHELAQATDAAISQSVRRQLIADVPLGAFLSGGIDSSLLVHYMAQIQTTPVKTFSVRFDAASGYDESGYAAAVAKQLGTEHHEFDAEQIDSDLLSSALGSLDQPLADPAYLPLLSLSKLTRKHVTVAISGDGGDELFGGYDRFLTGESCYPPSTLNNIMGKLIAMGALPAGLLRRTLSGQQRLLWDRVKFGPFPGTRKDMASILHRDVVGACRIEHTMEDWLNLARSFSQPIDSDSLIRADLWTYLSENCLVKTDRASMFSSLEVRVPLLGQPVADLILPQPASIKMAGQTKAVLRHLAKHKLPPVVWDRPKHGFSVPLNNYYRTLWRDRCEHWVQSSRTLAPFLNSHEVQRLWRMALRGRGDSRSMYTLISLLGWLESHPLEA